MANAFKIRSNKFDELILVTEPKGKLRALLQDNFNGTSNLVCWFYYQDGANGRWLHEIFQKRDFLEITIAPPATYTDGVPEELMQAKDHLKNPVRIKGTEVKLNGKRLVKSYYEEEYPFQVEIQIDPASSKFSCFAIDEDLNVKNSIKPMDLKVGDTFRFNFF